MGYGLCNLFSPHPSPLPRGEGTLHRGFVLALPHWIPAYAGKTVRGSFAFGVGEAVLEEVFGGFEAVVELGVGVLSLHGVEEELGDRVAFLCAVDDVLLELCWDAHEGLSVFQLSCMDISHLSPVIPWEARHLKSANGVCAKILDSSLRSAAFRMTEDEGAPFGMTE